MRLIPEIHHATRSRRGLNANAGFSMVELSVVLAIISVVAVMGLELTAQYMGRTAYKATQEKLEVIDQAIARYTKVYNKLPCPAAPTLTITSACYGKEANGNDGTGCGNTLGVCSAPYIGATALRYGDVPVRDLGLPLHYMVDGYGSRIRYITSGAQVYNRAYHITNNFDRFLDVIKVRSGKLDSNCGATGDLCQDRGLASYFLLSFGADRRGGTTPHSSAISPACNLGGGTPYARVDGYTDTANCRFGSSLALVKNGSTAATVPQDTFYDSRFNNGTTDAHFDDVVKWRSKGNL